jgi:cell wall-associated NlpC family hydrolase
LPSSSEPSPADHFRLEGPSRRPDPRINAYRPDVADVQLAGVLFAPHYARAQPAALGMDNAMLRAAPEASARGVSQLVRGEGFETLEISGGWAWGRCLHDDYVGYLPAAALTPPQRPSHRVASVLAPVFAAPDIKAPVVTTWPIGARAEVTGEAGDFLTVAQGFVHRRHLVVMDAVAHDPVAVAERLLGQPYLWGGRGAGGVDCSGLIQVALDFAGIAAPRDSDLQRDALGEVLAAEAPLRRGDLLFFPGHVGVMVDGVSLLHANAYWMAVVIEPLADVIARLISAKPGCDPVLARKRLG